jgi:hypothetical protein
MLCYTTAMPSNENEQTNEKTMPSQRQHSLFKVLRRTALAVIALVLLSSIVVYALTPGAIRQPAYQHYHLRMQVIADGQIVSLADKAFQEGYTKDNCNAELTTHPFHFHDNRDQLAHVHWDKMTGGLLLKYYGWNYIGGLPNTLGYRFDQLPKVQSVRIHGRVLPNLAKGDQLYIYTGDSHTYQARSTGDFLRQDFEKFFNKQSNLGNDSQAALLDTLFPKAYAHGTESHAAEANLESVNNLLGNVVIFAQASKPSDAQVKARFEHLAPLEASTCGG